MVQYICEIKLLGIEENHSFYICKLVASDLIDQRC